MSTAINFLCGQETCHHLMQPQDLSTSVKFLCRWETFRQLPSTFIVSGRTFFNFRQLSVQPQELPSTSVNFLFHLKTFHQLQSTSLHLEELSIFINFPCGPQIICQFLSTFRAAGRHSVNFRLISVRPGDLISSFLLSMRTSVNFRQHFVKRETFCQLLSTSFASERPFVNFCQLYLWPEHLTSIFCAAGDIPSTSINFLYHQKTYCHLQSTFHAAQRSSVNFYQLSVPPGDTSATSINFPCRR